MRLHIVLIGFLVGLSACTGNRRNSAGFFVATLGNDTLAVESYQMGAQSINGTSVVRSPKTTMRNYSMTMNSDGLPESFMINFGPVGGASQITRNYRYSDDSVEIVTTQNGATKTSTIKVSGRPYPFFVNIFGVWDYAVSHALTMQGEKKLSVLVGNRALQYVIQGKAPGRLELTNAENDFSPIAATVDSNGTLEKFDLTATTDKYIADRAQTMNVESLAKDFAAREEAGHGVGVLSPRDTARAVIDNATVLVDYGRPEMRGRTIFGNVVPWDVVWRLGANAATQLITNKTLSFGRTIVKPGTYSLFALPSEKGWKLIINNQHGQWGTVYDESKDLARLALKTTRLKNPVEQFVVDVSGHGRNGVLQFTWENTEASIPFTVR
jgi:hypothetical protein